MTAIEIARLQIKADEALKLKPYLDTKDKLTIGYGRNLTDNGISEAEADAFLDYDITQAFQDAIILFPNLTELTDARQAVLINMSFNMGRVSLSKFHDLRAAIADKEFIAAADAMQASLWSKETGARATRLISIMRGV